MALDHRRLKGHSELMHMRISYHFLAGLADLYIATHARETGSEKRIRNIQSLVELTQLQVEIVIIDPTSQQSTHFVTYREFTDGFVQGKPLISKNAFECDHQWR